MTPYQCCGSMTFRTDTDTNPDPDPAIFVIDLQDTNKKNNFWVFAYYFFEGKYGYWVYIIFKDKKQ